MHIDVLPGTEDLQDVTLTAVVGGDRRTGYQRLVNAMVPEEHCVPLQHLNPLAFPTSEFGLFLCGFLVDPP